jgi:DinB superfamily
MDHCDECGFVYSTLGRTDIAPALRELGPQYAARLTGDQPRLRRRPAPDVWSALEYSCHMRDVLVVQRERLAQALVEDCPTFVPMGREERVVRDRYNEQDPAVVARELVEAADAAADAFAALDDAGWARTGIYNFPAPAERTMLWLGQHTVHEGRHHLRDVDR